MSLCKYKDLFGKPETGIHSYRVFGIAYLDVLVTIAFAFLLAYIFKWSYVYTTIGTFILGIVIHRLLCARTAVDKLLFPNAT